MNWQRPLSGKLKTNERLARHTSFKIGGPAQFWFEPRDPADLQNLLRIAGKQKIPLRVIGAGSNILVDDRGVKGVVLKLNSPYFKRVALNNRIVSAGAGLPLSKLISFARENSLSGIELLAGIPGTVGGALIMNAGNAGARVLDAVVMDRQGRVRVINNRQAGFGYRRSNLQGKIILSARFKLIKRDKKEIKNNIHRYLGLRYNSQDLSLPSCGCFFKNPEAKSVPSRFRSGLVKTAGRVPASYLIERCGLKGSSFGDAAVSRKHANFIINKGRAGSADILRLTRYINRCVKKKFKLKLYPEVIIWR
jgi:UDP-N-acetylmuramate dehydrogenase